MEQRKEWRAFRTRRWGKQLVMTLLGGDGRHRGLTEVTLEEADALLERGVHWTTAARLGTAQLTAKGAVGAVGRVVVTPVRDVESGRD
jgi:hypothetical protein